MKRNELLIEAVVAGMNSKNIVLSPRALYRRILTVWFYLYEILEQTKTHLLGKKS